MKIYSYPNYSNLVPGKFAELLSTSNLQELFTAPYFSPTNNPKEADFLLFPHNVDRIFQVLGPESCRHFLTGLPHYKNRGEKHIFFMYDDLSLPLGIPGIIFRLSHDRNQQDENSITLPPKVLGENYFVQKDSVFKYHFSFSGSLVTHFCRLQMILAFMQPNERLHLQKLASEIDTLCKNRNNIEIYQELSAKISPQLKKFFPRIINFSGITGYLNITVDHHHLLTKKEQRESREIHKQVMRDSILILCPRGRSVYSIRFFETLAACRIPLLISDNYIPPLESRIDYDNFIFRLPQAELLNIKSAIKNIFSTQDNNGLSLRCRLARSVWEEYFSPEKISKYLYLSLTTKTGLS